MECFAKNASLTLSLSGMLAGAECEKFRENVRKNLKPGIKTIYLDLKELDHIDSLGLGVLVGLKMTCKKNDTNVVLLSPKPDLLRILKTVRLNLLFEIMETAKS